MTGFVLMLVLAVTVEAIVQYIKAVIDMITAKDYKTAITQLAALLVSVMLCLLSGADVYGALGVTFVGGWAGMVLTGVFLLSRGANYAADLVKRLQGRENRRNRRIDREKETGQGDTPARSLMIRPRRSKRGGIHLRGFTFLSRKAFAF